jgi:hypothetical protein
MQIILLHKTLIFKTYNYGKSTLCHRRNPAHFMGNWFYWLQCWRDHTCSSFYCNYCCNTQAY